MQAGRHPSPPGTDALLGQLVGTSYQLVRRIGAGGMGAVYEAKHLQQGTRAAVKVLNRELAQDTTLIERFRREAKITASLSNPHTVKVFGFDQPDGGLPYMVMEYLEGEDLETRLKRVHRLTIPQAQEMLRCLSIALSEAHGAGVVHRDLKPANIFYAKEGTGERVKLLDFGLSKAMKAAGEGLTFFGQLLGTVWYMSPEQTRGTEATTSSDIYSLGVVLYQALTGELPFAAENPHEYLYRIQSASPRALSEVAPDLPPGLEPLLVRAMAREPADRFSSVRELHDSFAGLFSMGGDHTSMSAIPQELARSKSLPPRAVTGAKLRAAPPKVQSDPSIRPAAQRTGSRPPLPGKALSDPNIKASRPPVISPAGTAKTVLGMPAQQEVEFSTPHEMPALSDATVVRPLAETREHADGQTFVAPASAFRPAAPPADGDADTRIAQGQAPLPLPLPVAAPSLRASSAPKLKPVPVQRPVTDPADDAEQEPDRTVPGHLGGIKPLRPAPQRPISEPEITSPGLRPNPLAAKGAVDGTTDESGGEVEGGSGTPNMAVLGFGIGAGLGAILLLGALVWRMLH